MGVDAALAPIFQERQPVLLGQHQIENDDVVIGAARFEIGFLAVLGQIDGKTLFFQAATQRPGQRLMIFDKQNPHVSAPGRESAWRHFPEF
jgi:hypothetical protein